jgi:hypothetical protein
MHVVRVVHVVHAVQDRPAFARVGRLLCLRHQPTRPHAALLTHAAARARAHGTCDEERGRLGAQQLRLVRRRVAAQHGLAAHVVCVVGAARDVVCGDEDLVKVCAAGDDREEVVKGLAARGGARRRAAAGRSSQQRGAGVVMVQRRAAGAGARGQRTEWVGGCQGQGAVRKRRARAAHAWPHHRSRAAHRCSP